MEISQETMQALDQLDWSSIECPRSVVEANPIVAEQLAQGKPSELVKYQLNIPGIPEPVEKTVQLITHKMKNDAGDWVLDPRIGVREMDESYQLKPENLRIVFDNGYSYKLNPENETEKKIIDSLLERREFTNQDGKKSTQYVCNICPIPLEIKNKSGETHKFYVGFDNRSLRPAVISENALRSRFLDKDGHSRIQHEVFGKGIKISDDMAKAMAEGQISAAFGKGINSGEPFATAISFNVARGEMREDHTARGESIRQAAYNHLGKQNRQAAAQGEAQAQKAKESKATKNTRSKAAKL